MPVNGDGFLLLLRRMYPNNTPACLQFVWLNQLFIFVYFGVLGYI